MNISILLPLGTNLNLPNFLKLDTKLVVDCFGSQARGGTEEIFQKNTEMRVLLRLLIGRMCHSRDLEAEKARNPCNFRSNYLSARLLGGLDKKQAEGGATVLRL